MPQFQHEFVYETEGNAEVDVCIEYEILEADTGYVEEIYITDVSVHTPGMGWGKTDWSTEDDIKNYIYDDYNMMLNLLEDARYD